MKTIIPCLIALAAPLTAGEIDPSQVPATAKWLLHADLDAMRETETGKTVLSQIEAEHGAKLRAFKRMFSLHVIEDLRDVTLTGDGRKDRAVILFDGKFDRDHIEDILKAADDYSASTHAGLTVHRWKDKGVTQYAAFATPGLLVFSHHEDLLRQQLNTLKSPATASADNPLLPEAGSRPLIAASGMLGEIEMPADSARLLRHAKQLKIGAFEADGRFSIRMSTETGDAALANRIRRVLDGMVAIAELGNPDLAGSDFQSEIQTKDRTGVTANMGMPVAPWLEILRKEAEKRSNQTKP